MRSFASQDVADVSMHSRSLCYFLRSDEKSWFWHHGLLGSDYASECKVDGDEAGHLERLYYFPRSDVKTGFGRVSHASGAVSHGSGAVSYALFLVGSPEKCPP